MHWDSNNMLAGHLCRIDPTYAALFSDWCTDRSNIRTCSIPIDQPIRLSRQNDPSGTCTSAPHIDSSTGPISSPHGGSSAPRALDLLERVLIYLNNSRNVLPMPIGACLLGVTGLSEEMLIPFLLAVRLGVDPSLLPSSAPGGTSQSHGRSATGDPMLLTMILGSHTTDGSSVVSDPEASSAPNKRSMSPECNLQTTLSSPKFSSENQGIVPSSVTYCLTPIGPSVEHMQRLSFSMLVDVR
ncbi:unnamed protein product [Echinostoma caproni]|uniref:Uncharacterized protein n=1 Tax=Echinostoma caproni TaxID=27848 RepID=A0A3P8I1U3_9TREM|nr:unnamed protein product [Echinostoma caproni]